MIKTVIFDLGGVLFTDGTKRAIGIISAKYGVPSEEVDKVMNGELGTKYRIGEITADEFWERTRKVLGIQADNKTLAEIWLSGYEMISGTEKIIKRLKAAGYEVLFLSDNVEERVNYIEEKYHFLMLFDDGIFSHVVKTRKPDKLMYELVLAKASHPPSQCIYIADKPKFLEPAKSLGMACIAFTNPEKLEMELKPHGLSF